MARFNKKEVTNMKTNEKEERLEQAYEIAGGYKSASEEDFKKALELVREKDPQFAQYLEALHYQGSSLKDKKVVTPIENNVNFIRSVYSNESELKSSVITDDEIKTAVSNTVILGNDKKKLSDTEKNDTFFEAAQVTTLLHLAADDNFADLSSEERKNTVKSTLKNDMLGSLKLARVTDELEQNKSKTAKSKNRFKGFRNCLNIEKQVVVAENAFKKVKNKTSKMFSSFMKKITTLAIKAEEAPKVYYSRATVAMHKAAIGLVAMSSLASPILSSCTNNTERKPVKLQTEQGVLSLTQDNDTIKDSKTLVLSPDTFKTQNLNDTIKQDTVSTAVSDSLNKKIEAVLDAETFNSEQTGPKYYAEEFAPVKEYKVVKDTPEGEIVTDDGSIENGTLAANNVEKRGGYMNTGITERQFHRMENFFKDRYGENSLENFFSKITDDMRAKGGVFEGLSQAQALFSVQQMIAWSNDKTGAFAPQIQTVMCYLQGCDEQINPEMFQSVKKVIDAVNVDGSIDGVTGKGNVMVKYFKTDDCGKSGSYGLVAVDGEEKVTTPEANKFVRMYELAPEVEEPVAEVQAPAPVVQEVVQDTVQVEPEIFTLHKDGRAVENLDTFDVSSVKFDDENDMLAYVAEPKSAEESNYALLKDGETVKNLDTFDVSRVNPSTNDAEALVVVDTTAADNSKMEIFERATLNELQAKQIVSLFNNKSIKLSRSERRILNDAVEDYLQQTELQELRDRYNNPETRDSLTKSEKKQLIKANKYAHEINSITAKNTENMSNRELRKLGKVSEQINTVKAAQDLLTSKTASYLASRNNGR